MFHFQSQIVKEKIRSISILKNVSQGRAARPFYGASKMAVTLGRKVSQSNQAQIKVGFHFRHNKSSKTRSKQACGLLQREQRPHGAKNKRQRQHGTESKILCMFSICKYRKTS